VLLGTAEAYAVLAGSEVTNTGPTVIHGGSVGVSPGTSVSGFNPPGVVTPPGTIDTSPTALQAQGDLTAAYVDAEARGISGSTPAELANLTLVAGVYAGPDHGALLLSGPLVLDGQGDPTSVFVIQTNSSLTTASASTVSLVRGAQECNVFWQVGSSATLGTNSIFRGNILAMASVTVTTGVTLHGRALAREAAVTLDTDVIRSPTCDLTPVPTTVDDDATTLPTTVPTTVATTAPTSIVDVTTTALGAVAPGAGAVTSVTSAPTATLLSEATATTSGDRTTVPSRARRGLSAPPATLADTGASSRTMSITGAALWLLGAAALAVRQIAADRLGRSPSS
jgi:hypothetical protein